jgi:hypothetical protein
MVSVLAAALAGRLLTTPSGTGPASSRRAATWPTADAISPTTPAGARAWPAPPPVPPGDATFSAVTTGEIGATTPTGNSAFCTSARAGLVSLGSQGLSTLKSLATQTGDAAPSARAFVESAEAEATRLTQTAPPALTQAMGTLAAAWSGLASALERAGYDRAAVAGLAIKYLASPAVALSWDALTRWAARNCGAGLAGGSPAGG